MKKAIIFLLLTLGLYAQDGEKPSPSPVQHFVIGPRYIRANVKPSGLPSLQGNMGGMQGLYEYKPFNFLYAGLELDWAYGRVHGGNGKRTLLDVNVQEKLGYTLAFWKNDFLLTFFTGFGYRHLSHGVHYNHLSAIDLRYNHFYVPVGILTYYQITDSIGIGGNVTWKGQVFSSVYISPIGGAYWKIQKKFKNFLVELPLSYAFAKSQNLSLIFKPFFEFWQDGQTTARSPSGLSLGLPKNSYIFWGAELNLQISF